MMKQRLFALALAALLLIPTGLSASADVIWEPYDDYYLDHNQDCDYHGRSYLANGQEGYLVVYDKPDGTAVDTAVNGTRFYVSFTYQDQWAVVQYDPATKEPDYGWGEDSFTGWIPLSDLALIYDGHSFDQDHAAEYHDYTGSYDALLGQDVVTYTYPNCGEGTQLGSGALDSDFSFRHAWTDEAGREWGYVGYFRGIRNCWICVSDPANPDLDSGKAETVYTAPAEPPTELSQAAEAPLPLTGVAVGLVAAVVIITALLIVRMGKKKQ